MRFERRLLTQKRHDEEWVNSYIDYGRLKRNVYAAAAGQSVDFSGIVAEEADKASRFFVRKTSVAEIHLFRLETRKEPKPSGKRDPSQGGTHREGEGA